ncbi:hypothetical protein ACK1U3_21075 [Pseudomonas promysalinigenes]
MVKSLKWQEGLILSVKVEEGFCCCSDAKESSFRSFDIFKINDDWRGLI